VQWFGLGFGATKVSFRVCLFLFIALNFLHGLFRSLEFWGPWRFDVDDGCMAVSLGEF
jgi:hypothetical protein